MGNSPFCGNVLIHSAQFINIATSIILDMFLNGTVWLHALYISFMMRIWCSISVTCLICEEVFSSIFVFLNSAHMGSNSPSIRSVLISHDPEGGPAAEDEGGGR